MRIFYTLCFICSLFVLFIVGVPQCDALEKTKGIRVSPAYVEITLKSPNEQKQIEFTYENLSNETIELELFPVDFKQGNNGQIKFLFDQKGTYSYSLSSFLTLSTNSLILAPKSKEKVVLTVKNRDDMSPGGHYATVVAREKKTNLSNRDTTILPSLSAMILLRKSGGERFNLSISDINWPQYSLVFFIPKQVIIQFKNEGNVHVVPYGQVIISDIFKRVTHTGIINTASSIIFPETRRYIPVDLKQIAFVLPLSLQFIVVNGHDSLNKTTYISRNTYIYIHPFILLGVVAIGVLFFMKKRKTK